MVKRILLLILMLLLIAYLVIAVSAFNRKPVGQTCSGFEVIIKDSTTADFITRNEIKAILQKKELYPIGKKMEKVSTKTLERELKKHPLINEVECYKTPSGKICAKIIERIPILRVMNSAGENYYIDNKGTIIPYNSKIVAHQAIVTGNVEKSFAMRDLYKFGVFLQSNPFWDALIEQINVLPDHSIELVPRVGNHLVYLGKLDNFESKLARLKEFYKKGLNQVGWNKYSRINLEFNNQIICTKQEEDNVSNNI